MALSNAKDLIRRKASFGKEVTDNSDELAALLMGLSDTFEVDNFEDLRQQALIAILIADPTAVAQFLAQSFFEGDHSLQQRSSILAALGLGARELAGFKDEQHDSTESFPSKKLPPALHKAFGGVIERSTSPLNRVALRLQSQIMEPLALESAEQLSGPSVLKVKTFSTRMAVEKARKKPTANKLAKIVADHFFFPLVGRWWVYRQAYGKRSAVLPDQLLPVYIRTLALLMHAAGPSTLSLPQMTAELWALLLSVHTSAMTGNKLGIMEAVLFALMVLLDVNDDGQRLAAEHAKDLVETQEWARLVLDRLPAGDAQVDKIRSLAAGVVMRCHAIAEKWQRILLGNVMDL